jgi:hypothetical protein
VERELDPLDIKLLHAGADCGEIHPDSLHQQRRLDRLDLEGYVESSRREPPEPGVPPSWVYRLTHKGHHAIEQRRRGPLSPRAGCDTRPGQ